MTASRKSRLNKSRDNRLSSDQDFWNDLYSRILAGKVVPIIGNSIRYNRIFDVDRNIDSGLQNGERTNEQLDRFASDHLSVNEELAELWAHKIGYPLSDQPCIPRVAQFNRVIYDDMRQAKNNYLHFLKERLLDIAEEDNSVADAVTELRTQLIEKSFSQIAAELDYPYYPPNRLDPLRVLAKLRLPIYLTTSYHDFIERQLTAEGAKVRTRFCLWNMEPEIVKPEHLPDRDYYPSPEEPVVYHLHGYEEYPRSLVLSEDDHLDYLLELAQDTNSNRPLIPPYLRSALEESSLLLLGYRVQDWDFRSLYSGLINLPHARLRMLDRTYSIAVQLDPKYQEGIANKEKARTYLDDYFRSANFRVEWSSIERFIATLDNEWNQRRNPS